MKNERSGIAVAGSTLVDKINEIAAYPASGELTRILGITTAVGGCVPNVSIDLKKISPELKISAIGKVGDDKEGKYLIDTLTVNGVDASGIKVIEGQTTTFTDVMSVTGGQRTFFTYAGADGELGADDFDFGKIGAKILHLGYFLLLKKIDAGEGAEILRKAGEHGLKTSIDMVSENSDRYALVVPCLKYTDYLIINETEAGKITGIEPIHANLEKIARTLKEMGVREKVIIHMPDCSVCCSNEGFSYLGAVDVPKSYIKGKTGAGDAFCAGALIGIYKGLNDMEIMDLASCTAIMALGAPDATSGLKTEAETVEFCKQFERIKVCL